MATVELDGPKAPAAAAVDEAARLAALRRYDILDTPPDGSFDRITALAANLFDVPIAIVSLVDHDRIWFKSHHGLDVGQIDREPGLCASAILQIDPYVLTDASTDPRSLANPLVAGGFGLRFYAAVPLRTGDGHNLGTLCVIDREPREIGDGEIARLEALAAIVIDQMELRLAARAAVDNLKQVVEEKEAALRRSAMLAKEVDHRVMNSLQLVSALLALQSRNVGADSASELGRAASRIAAVGRVHQRMHRGNEGGIVDVLAYLEGLCDDLSSALYEGEPIIVRGVARGLPSEQVAPIGLIVNELVTNAAKHGGGAVTVSFEHADDGHYMLSVADDGEGLPKGFKPTKATGLGMKVVVAIARQLGGRLSFGRSGELGGAQFTIRFPAERKAAEA